MGVKIRGTFKNFTALNISALQGLLEFNGNDGDTILTLPTPIRENHRFVEWNTEPDGSGTTVLPSNLESLSSSVVYAIWQEAEEALVWQQVQSDFASASISINDVEYSNGVWLACGSSRRLRRSTNGYDWFEVSLDEDWSSAVNGLATDGSGTWMAVGSSGDIKRSTDNGESWTTLNSGVSDTLQSIAYGNGVWVACGAERRLIRSDNNGDSWTSRSSGFSNESFSSNRRIEDVATDGNGNWIICGRVGQYAVSTNDGLNWSRSTLGTIAYYKVRTDGNGRWIMARASSTSPVTISDNNGSNWSSVSIAGLSTNPGSAGLATDGNGTWIASLGSTLEPRFIRSTDNGSSWQVVDGGTFHIGNSSRRAVATDSNGLWISGNTSSTITLSVDDGETWEDINPRYKTFSTTTDQVNHFGIGYNGEGTWRIAGERNLRALSTDGGKTWRFENNLDNALGSTSTRNGIAGEGDRWITSASNTVHTTSNNVTWSSSTVSTLVSPAAWQTIIRKRGIWLMAGRSGSSGSFRSRVYRSSAAAGTSSWVSLISRLVNVFSGYNDIDIGMDDVAIAVSSGENGEIRRFDDAKSGSSGNTNVVPPGEATTRFSSIGTDSEGVWVTGTTSGTLFRSTDNGLTWTEVDSQFNGMITRVQTNESGIWIAVGAGGQMLRSINNGLTWTPVVSGAPGTLRDVRYGDGVWVTAGDNGFIAVSTDDGVTWNEPEVQTNMYSQRVGHLAYANGVYFLYGAGATLQRSTTDGIAWRHINIDFGDGAIRKVENDGENVWIAAGDGGRLRRSTDNGLSWATVTSGFSTSDIIWGLANNKDDRWVIAGNNGLLRRSSDNGLTWTTIDAGFGLDTIRSVDTDNGSVWMASGENGKLARSSDNGLNWDQISSGFGSESIICLVTNKLNTWLAGGENGTIRRSVDNGETWTTVSAGFNGKRVLDIYFNTGGKWLAVGSQGECRLSRDNGVTWESINTGLGGVNLRGVRTDDEGNWLIAGTANTRITLAYSETQIP